MDSYTQASRAGRRLGKLKRNPFANSHFEIGNLHFAVFFFVSLLLPWLVGASPVLDASDLFREGNAAFDHEDYQTALDLYHRAEGKIADPGWLAFNEGAALYRLGRYREAEIQYWLSRQDATGPRLHRVLYDLGNSRLRQAGSRDAALLERAIGSYEECIRQPEIDPVLANDARHNLALARQLLKMAKAGAENRPNEPNRDFQRPEEPKAKAQPSSSGVSPGDEDGTGSGQRSAEASESDHQTNSKNAQHQPGIGNLPPIPDSDQSMPLSSEDISAYLQKVTERILKERRNHYGKSVSRPSQNVKDW
jgi:hypothetical protein